MKHGLLGDLLDFDGNGDLDVAEKSAAFLYLENLLSDGDEDDDFDEDDDDDFDEDDDDDDDDDDFDDDDDDFDDFDDGDF